ncbi:MAG TPA: hypothetical protein VK203_22665 [Nostocaceae cyanobacterium]|nr:hypothetical protein [Nostocaceae cyanobacterium]
MDTHPANVGLLMARIQAEAKALQAEIKAFQAQEKRANEHEQHHTTMASIEAQTHGNQQKSAQIDLAASRLILEQKSAFFKLKFGMNSPASGHLMEQQTLGLMAVDDGD